MSSGQTVLEWEIGENAEWLATESLPEEVGSPGQFLLPASSPPRLRTVRRLVRDFVLAALLTTFVLGYSFWREYQASLFRLQTEIQSVIDLESWVWEQDDKSMLQVLLDEQATEGWIQLYRWNFEWIHRWVDGIGASEITVQDVDLMDDVALVEILVTRPGEPWISSPYRETRFYRWAGDRWVRTAPDARFWGPRQSLSTEFFHIQYYQRDAAVAQALASQIDAMYYQLRQDVGLGPPPPDQRFSIEILPATNVVDWRFNGDRLTIPSPALMPVPVDITPTDALLQSVLEPLASDILIEAIETLDISFRWVIVAEGMRLWLSWEDRTLPSFWIYFVEGLLQHRLRSRVSPHLTYLLPPGPERVNELDQLTRIMIARTLISYVVETYGRESLPALMRGMSQYRTWDALVPAVFGTPVEEFEKGWRAYLAQHQPTVLRSSEE